MQDGAHAACRLLILSLSDKSHVSENRDPCLDTLLDLDGQILFVDPEGGHWVKFVVTRVPVVPEKPHGLDYSLTLAVLKERGVL